VRARRPHVSRRDAGDPIGKRRRCLRTPYHYSEVSFVTEVTVPAASIVS
jgi:hypothetical protein